MIHGSDHWFIRPSEWSAITDTNQRYILDEIQNGKNSLGNPFRKSILNSVRRILISAIENGMNGAPNEKILQKILLDEKQKLSDV